jgi:CBS domain-containing protein
MKIREALEKIGSLAYLAIPGETTLEEAAQTVTGRRQIRGVYVLDQKGRLMGTISLGVLIRHVTSARHKPQFHLRSLLTRITSERVEDIMDRHVIYATCEDDLGHVLDRMVTANIKEIPIVDEERRVIGAMSLLDLWKLAEEGGSSQGAG